MNIVDVIRIKYYTSNDFIPLPLEDAIKKIAETDAFKGLDTIQDMNAFMRNAGWERHGKSLFDFLTGLLDDEFHEVQLKRVGDKLLWKHGAPKKKK